MIRAVIHRQRQLLVRIKSRRFPFNDRRAFASQTDPETDIWRVWGPLLWTSAALSLAAATGAVILSDQSISEVECETEGRPHLLAVSPRNRHTQSPRNVNIPRLKSLRGRNLHDKYKVEWDKVMGEGAYGSVHPARLAVTGEKVALKKISRRYTNSSTFRAETDALLRIYDNGGHPNISGLRDIYQDHTYYYLILDLVTGGEMFDHLINFGAYSEADAARILMEMSSALAFLHGVGVVHNDLKPENLLLSTKSRLDGTIKIIDFGCASVQKDEYSDDDDAEFAQRQDTKTDLKNGSSTGTTAYWSPERFRKGTVANTSMDMWSVGVILYIMLTGVHPFDVDGVCSDEEIAKRIQENPHPPLTKALVGHLSESAVDLILKLMEPDPKLRLTAYQMMQHPWVRGETALKEKIQDSDKKLSRFKDLRYKLEAGFFAAMIRLGHTDVRMSEYKKPKDEGGELDTSSANLLKRAFDYFDEDGSGIVTSDNLARVTERLTDIPVSSKDTREFLQIHHDDGEQLVSESEHEAVSLAQFNKLFSGLKQKHYPRGHYVFRAGEHGDAMYFLSSGKVEIQTRKGQLVSILRSGDFFGEGSLLDRDARRFTSAKCATPVDVLEIKRADFDRYVGASESVKNELQQKWRARSLEYAKNLLRFQKNVRVRAYKQGEVVYREGEPGTSMFRVDDHDGGELDVSHGGNIVHKYVGGDSFGESSLLFQRPRSSTVTCSSKVCRLHEMKAKHFMEVLESSPEMAATLRNMSRKRLFKKAVKAFAWDREQDFSDSAIVAAFHAADSDRSGCLNEEEVRALMHRMDPNFPMEEIRALLRFVDVDQDGKISLEEFKRLFRQFEDVD